MWIIQDKSRGWEEEDGNVLEGRDIKSEITYNAERQAVRLVYR